MIEFITVEKNENLLGYFYNGWVNLRNGQTDNYTSTRLQR